MSDVNLGHSLVDVSINRWRWDDRKINLYGDLHETLKIYLWFFQLIVMSFRTPMEWHLQVGNVNMETQSEIWVDRKQIIFLKTTTHAGMWCSRPSQCWGSLVMRLNISSIKNTIPDLLVPARAGKHTQLKLVISPIERKYLTGCTNPNYSGDKLAFSKLTVVPDTTNMVLGLNRSN